MMGLEVTTRIEEEEKDSANRTVDLLEPLGDKLSLHVLHAFVGFQLRVEGKAMRMPGIHEFGGW